MSPLEVCSQGVCSTPRVRLHQVPVVLEQGVVEIPQLMELAMTELSVVCILLDLAVDLSLLVWRSQVVLIVPLELSLLHHLRYLVQY
jgi:hypothetical protein